MARPAPASSAQKLLSLPFRLIAARHRLDVLDEAMQQRLLEARRVFRRDLPEEATGQIEFFDPERYNASASLQDNILFGKIAYGEADAPVRVPALISEVLNAMSLRAAVVDIGLELSRSAPAGRGCRWRSGSAPRSPASLLKRPDLLILNEATTALDGHGPGQGQRGHPAGHGRARADLGAAPRQPGARFRPGPGHERRQAAGAGHVRRAQSAGFVDRSFDRGGMTRARRAEPGGSEDVSLVQEYELLRQVPFFAEMEARPA